MHNSEFIAIRLRLGLTQRQVANLLDRSTAWVQGIEQRKYDCPAYAILAMRHLEANPALIHAEELTA